MEGTSVRKSVAVDREDRIAALRARMDQMGAAPTIPAPKQLQPGSIPGPEGSGFALPRAGVTHLSDTPVLALELIKSAGFVAVVGWPELILSEVPDLSKVVVIPDPGPDPLNTVAVLTEGMDLVLYRTSAPIELSPARARPLLGKLRKTQAALVLVNATVPSPQLSVAATVTQYHGIGAGTGRIRGLDIAVQSEGKKGLSAGRIQLGAPAQRARLRVI